MDNQEIENWSNSVDESDITNLAANLPEDAELGSIHQDGLRLWRRVVIVSGSVAGRWAYWKYLNPQEPYLTQFDVIVDRIFNGQAHHFAGMLAHPYSPIAGQQQRAWILVHPRVTAPIIQYRQLRAPKIRYERSNEIYDPETGTSTYINKFGLKDAEEGEPNASETKE